MRTIAVLFSLLLICGCAGCGSTKPYYADSHYELYLSPPVVEEGVVRFDPIRGKATPPNELKDLSLEVVLAATEDSPSKIWSAVPDASCAALVITGVQVKKEELSRLVLNIKLGNDSMKIPLNARWQQ